MRRKTTAADVARAAKVSSATVDRVLNGRGSVSAEKERRVIEWAHRLRLDRNLELRPTRTIRIGVVMGHPSNPFYESLRQAFARANTVFFSANVQTLVSYFDALVPDQAAHIMRKVAQANDALVVISPDHPIINEALRDIAATKPLLTMVTDLPGTGRLAYVGLDNRSAGRVAGDLMGRFLGREGGDVVIVSDLHNMVALGEREFGFRAVLAERHKRCRLVSVIETRDQRDRAGELVREAIAQYPGIVGIYVVSTGNRAVANVLRQLHRAESTVMITHELTPNRRQLLLEGSIDAIIDQNPELEAFTTIEKLAHHFGRLDAPPARLITPFTLFFRENC